MYGTLVFPTKIAPAFFSFSTTSASRFAKLFLNLCTPHVVGCPAISKASLIVTGMPWSGPKMVPLASFLSASLAVIRAFSKSRKITAFILISKVLIRSIAFFTTS